MSDINIELITTEQPQITLSNQGARGKAGTTSVGTTTTLPYGTPAFVTNTGTPSDAVLNFGIPQGENGTGIGDMVKAVYDPANGSAQVAFASQLSGYVPTGRTINSKALTSNITLSASDVGAYSSTDTTVTVKGNTFNGNSQLVQLKIGRAHV